MHSTHGVAAADDREAVAVGDARATAKVPSANAGHSNTPIGPFQKTVFAPAIRRAKSVRDSGPMSRPSQPSGSASNPVTCVSASAANSEAATTSVGSTTSNENGFSERTSSAIFPPIRTSSALAAEVLEHGNLVFDLRAARDDHERALDLAEQRAQVLQLLEQQQPGVGGQQLGDADGRRVRAMRRAERVVDEQVAALRELARERGIVLRLAGVEARVLEHA